ncbi:hypothetical protein [Jiangella asiatica]|uniref:Uncharacterized protein n=1 Tax=Jiangella asiatica TaxID=2530372 RepID=A0A4R5DDM3_9ACTN|nr:hypothetical protein [Jiangella asiatica]TDE08373.1 hypothetical protein E1269_17885 [Jiangella asiatica]
MKLLEDVPSAVAHSEPQRRTALTLAVTAAFLLVAALLGVYLVATSDGGSDGSASDGLPPPEGTLADWATGVTDACTTVAAEHPVMAENPQVRVDAANLGAASDGTHALVTGVRQVPLPSDDAEQERAAAAVAAGEQAAEAWGALAESPEAPAAEQLTEASALTTAFVAGVTELGATCAPIG